MTDQAAPETAPDSVPESAPESAPEFASDSAPPAPAGAAPVPDLSALETAYDLLAARLRAAKARGPVSGADRALLKQEIVVLFRQVQRAMAAVAHLEGEVKALAGAWKELPVPATGDDEPATPSVTHAPPEAAPVRVDHLGASTHVTKGWSRLAAGDGAGAEAELLRALELVPDDAEAGGLLSWALLAQERLDDATEVAERVLALHPHSALARVGLGHACLRRGVFPEAIEHLAIAIRDDTDRKATLYATFHLGGVYLQREMYEDAVAFFRRALALGPNLIEAYHEMGRAQWRGGDQPAALETWRAGAAAGKFSAWGARCEALRVEGEEGREPAVG